MIGQFDKRDMIHMISYGKSFRAHFASKNKSRQQGQISFASYQELFFLRAGGATNYHSGFFCKLRNKLLDNKIVEEVDCQEALSNGTKSNVLLGKYFHLLKEGTLDHSMVLSQHSNKSCKTLNRDEWALLELYVAGSNLMRLPGEELWMVQNVILFLRVF